MIKNFVERFMVHFPDQHSHTTPANQSGRYSWLLSVLWLFPFFSANLHYLQVASMDDDGLSDISGSDSDDEENYFSHIICLYEKVCLPPNDITPKDEINCANWDGLLFIEDIM